MRVANQATLQELAERIDQADAVVIGGGSGLSSAAGYDHYHWSPALSEALAPFREQYGFTSPLAGFYHCFSSYGEQWGYYSQYIRNSFHQTFLYRHGFLHKFLLRKDI